MARRPITSLREPVPGQMAWDSSEPLVLTRCPDPEHRDRACGHCRECDTCADCRRCAGQGCVCACERE
ncbi:hypothetical protein SAMN06297387_13130 [Streptomyces zhaozhouensis]|uniref:Uncharacterized protein n=1 Tax=Streptomyces zhaozhouensis TaxID=1300267 RepID=A0A286E999_9ACTN|nr:hypothetical protein [Streptomyces zhaozhouensis]SOD67476.1 hypothetical protein SAMN06297387_13130 [Streptomyces zhaozhouensis]